MVARKSTARPAPAAEKASATTAPAKKTPAKKTPAKKAPAKKAAAKAPAKAPAKKAAAKRAPAKAAVQAPAAAAEQVAPLEISVGTDAAFAGTVDAPPSPDAPPTPDTLRNISEVRHFFRTNTVPIFFVGATPFNLLGLDRWVRNFHYITFYDGWDGAHPRVFTPAVKPDDSEFDSGESINNWLLRNAEVRAFMASKAATGVRPKVAMVFFDAETERICAELGIDLILPPAALREELDSKIVTTRLGDEAGAPSVPNVLTRADSWAELTAIVDEAGLGRDLVIQTPYGDSGKTTFFVSSETDWDLNAENMVGQDLKIMKRINNLPVAVEAVITRSGTIVGPYMTELTGHRELTPYRGGWCGNEMFPGVLSPERRALANGLIRRLGDRLGKEGYRGFFEVDLLVDTDSGEVYLGELNPRISGASSITNVTAGAYADVPLFLFHLLEFLDVQFELDVDEINERWSRLAYEDVWSQMIIKQTDDVVEAIVAAPVTGQYYLDRTGTLQFRRAALDWHQLQDESEAFFLRIYGVGDYRWKGADLGILVTKGRLQTDVGGTSELTIRAKHLIDSVRAQYRGLPVGEAVVRRENPAGGSVGAKA